MSNIFIGLKKTCLDVLDRGERGKDIETGLKEGGEIEMSTAVLHSLLYLLTWRWPTQRFFDSISDLRCGVIFDETIPDDGSPPRLW